jgi:hypothetical protein
MAPQILKISAVLGVLYITFQKPRVANVMCRAGKTRIHVALKNHFVQTVSNASDFKGQKTPFA